MWLASLFHEFGELLDHVELNLSIDVQLLKAKYCFEQYLDLVSHLFLTSPWNDYSSKSVCGLGFVLWRPQLQTLCIVSKLVFSIIYLLLAVWSCSGSSVFSPWIGVTVSHIIYVNQLKVSGCVTSSTLVCTCIVNLSLWSSNMPLIWEWLEHSLK